MALVLEPLGAEVQEQAYFKVGRFEVVDDLCFFRPAESTMGRDGASAEASHARPVT